MGVFDGSGRKKKRSKLANRVLFSVLVIYLAAITTGGALAIYDVLAPLGLQELLIGLFFSVGSLLVFLFGILYVISIFYYSGDVTKLLPLPLKADEIIGAKLIVTMAWEYLYLAFLILPPLIVYAVRSQAGFVFYLLLMFNFILLPVIPLCMASILVMLMMRFTPLARNKDRFNLISGLLVMILALGFAFGVQSLSSFNQADLARLIQSGTESIARLTTIFFPGTAQAVRVMTAQAMGTRIIQLVILILMTGAALFLTFFAARHLYFAGVMGVGSSAARHRKLLDADWQGAAKSGSPFITYCLKDLRILVRTPVFFMNNVLMNFLWPVFFIIPLLTGSMNEEIGTMIEQARSMLFAAPGSTAAKVIAAYFALLCFVAGTNGITESALSREGNVFYIMKIVPMSWWQQIMAKITVGILLGCIGALLPTVIVIVFLKPPAWFILALLAVLPGAVLMPNICGIFFELFWPKLEWDNEQKAVKQNLNVLYGMIASLLLAGLIVAPVLLGSFSVTAAAMIIGIGSLAEVFVLLIILHRILPGRMNAIEP